MLNVYQYRYYSVNELNFFMNLMYIDKNILIILRNNPGLFFMESDALSISTGQYACCMFGNTDTSM